tara:strand:- start:124 stop:273 length:150 start_codon:yes stop_codon:yes gene_type:complete
MSQIGQTARSVATFFVTTEFCIAQIQAFGALKPLRIAVHGSCRTPITIM